MSDKKVTKEDLKYLLKKILYLKEGVHIAEQEIAENQDIINKAQKKIDTLMRIYKEDKAEYSPENDPLPPDKSTWDLDRIFKRRHKRDSQNIILRKLSLLTNSFFWSDVKYNVRKFFRFPIRLIEYSPVLYDMEDWDFNYLLTFMEYQLDRMQKSLEKDGNYVGCEKRAQEIRETIEHIKRFRDVDKYTIDVDTDEYLNNHISYVDGRDSEGKPLWYRQGYVDDKLGEQHFRIHEAQRRLEEWHWSQIWKNISKKSRRWGW